MPLLKSPVVANALTILIPVSVVFLLRFQTTAFVNDDAYMTFRVVRNLLSGDGFVCNPGEYVLSTTTPLWAVTLAFLSIITSTSAIDVYLPFSIFLGCLNVVAIYLLASSYTTRPYFGFAASMFYALSWHANYSSIIGMESEFVVSLILAVTLLSRFDSTLARCLTGLVAGLSFTARPEGALLIVALLVAKCLNKRRIPWVELAVSATVVLAYWAWMLSYFGSVLPQAALAKSLAYHREDFQALHSLAGHLVLLFLSYSFDPFKDHYMLLSAIVFLAVIVFGVERIYRQCPEILVLALFGLLFLLLYTFSNPHMFEWYVVLVEPLYCIGFVWGAKWVLDALFKNSRRKIYRLGPEFITCLLITLALFRHDLPRLSLSIGEGSGGYGNWPALIKPDANERYKLTALGPTQREALYIKAASLIAPDVSQATTVLAPEFGAFGYYSQAKVISSIGHVNPEVFPYLPAPREEIGRHINNGISLAMVKGLRPDYVLSLETFIRNSLLPNPWIAEHYEVYAFFQSPVFGSKGIYLLKRVKDW